MKSIAAPPPEQLEIELEGDEEETQELLHTWGFTDGLPVVIPTRERVDRLCAGAQHYPMESLGNLAPREGTATVQKVAINAVMAGCLPEHMPVLEAAIGAIQKPDFNLIGMQTTTHPCALLCIVQGPLAHELGMNAGPGCMGPGNRANASIGRALRLVLQNIGGAIAGETDNATQGSPAKSGFCFAENESASPWPPLRMTLGFSREESCVTVAAAEGPHNVNDHGSTEGESILNSIAETMATVGSNNLYSGGDHFIVFGPEHAAAVAKAGFSREAVQAFLFEKARVSIDRISSEKLEELTSWGGYADQLDGWNGRIPLAREAGLLRVLVAGGAGKHSCWIPTFAVGYAQSERIETQAEICRI
ncbi:MAG: hypothetical protein GY723_19625 [bacterium]|nr:hypothetical protein [bacterium]MCP5067728.1 hypothetical protein [bacterium]